MRRQIAGSETELNDKAVRRNPGLQFRQNQVKEPQAFRCRFEALGPSGGIVAVVKLMVRADGLSQLASGRRDESAAR
jgi:hypothetical protein